ncbi:3823_t:CDS:2 [Acaulospora colombiana]|uniref:3823_t:CDS:1 n=1 Tax=Acaulospora colombiana TaxID=27376 RepID=A0ACA9PBD0_9GLOM|nr:3823_t:CDS:2 [Acaulospora colombiana]
MCLQRIHFYLALTDASTLTSVITRHITVLGGRYKGRFYAWDVCNEILNEGTTTRIGTIEPQIDSFGPRWNIAKHTFVSIAFKAARSADSTAKLYINGQIQIGGSTGMVNALTVLAASGVSEVAITELNIPSANPTDYVNIVKACLAVSACVGITNECVIDSDFGWRTSNPACLWTSAYQPKPAVNAIINALKIADDRSTSGFHFDLPTPLYAQSNTEPYFLLL